MTKEEKIKEVMELVGKFGSSCIEYERGCRGFLSIQDIRRSIESKLCELLKDDE